MRKVFGLFIIVLCFIMCFVLYTKCDMKEIPEYSDDPLTTPITGTIITFDNTTTTTITTTTTVTTTTKTEEKTTTTTTKKKTELVSVDIFDLTYYIPRPDQSADGLCGGSGRELIDCSKGNAGVMGSVACKRIFEKYGYSNNGKRTTIYIDVPEMPELTGYYFVDDCCSSNCVIDLYYSTPSNCPFENIGVIHNAMCYVME